MSQEIRTIALKVPCFLINTGEGWIMIDTGDSSDRAHLEEKLDHMAAKPGTIKLIILTHGDFDHAGNASFLREKYGVAIAMHPDDSGMAERGDQSWNRKTEPDRVTMLGRMITFIASRLASSARFDTFKPDIFLQEGYDLSGYGFEAKVIHLPGHSKGSIGILTAGGDLFCGDLLMNMIKPDLHFFIDDLGDCHDSLTKLKRLKIDTVYPGHGKPFPVDRWTAKTSHH